MDWFQLIMMLVKIAFIIGLCLQAVPFLVWFERRGSAWMQKRVGPNRVGPFGLLQPIADAIKFFFKEDFTPDKANKFYYYLAPLIALVAPFAALAVIPFGSHILINGQKVALQMANVNTGVLFILAFAGLEVYPVIVAGWSSNNKYAIMGALRGSSQIVSYEISMGLSLLSMLLIYGTLDLNQMVAFQSKTLFGFIPMWGGLLNPLAALIFWISIFAETNRLPFDLPEGESELVAGYHLEYGAMKFALFFMAEYVAMIMASALIATLFFGGYGMLPGMGYVANLIEGFFTWGPEGHQNLIAALEFLSFFLKVAFFMFVFIWVRWTLPRFRYDQLINLGWKILFPLALGNLALVAIALYFIHAP